MTIVLVDEKFWPHTREPFLISFPWLTQNLHYCSLTWHNYFGTSRHMIRRATLNICASLQPPILGSEKSTGKKVVPQFFWMSPKSFGTSSEKSLISMDGKILRFCCFFFFSQISQQSHAVFWCDCCSSHQLCFIYN